MEQAARITEVLEHTGRTKTWLAREMGYSYSYVTKVLSGEHEPSPAFLEAAADALSSRALVATVHQGLAILVPRSVYRREASEATIAFETESAWKEAWVAEHGADVLAAAAERAWVAVHEVPAR